MSPHRLIKQVKSTKKAQIDNAIVTFQCTKVGRWHSWTVPTAFGKTCFERLCSTDSDRTFAVTNRTDDKREYQMLQLRPNIILGVSPMCTCFVIILKF